jgi:CO/xanthine dehydrogenase FAD-binding subunit
MLTACIWHDGPDNPDQYRVSVGGTDIPPQRLTLMEKALNTMQALEPDLAGSEVAIKTRSMPSTNERMRYLRALVGTLVSRAVSELATTGKVL